MYQHNRPKVLLHTTLLRISITTSVENMESTQDTRSQASYISVAASLTAKLRCCFRGDTTIITGSYNPRGAQQGAPQGDPNEDIPISIALEEAPHVAPQEAQEALEAQNL